MSQRRGRSRVATQASQSYVLDDDVNESFSKSQISALSAEEQNQIVGSVIRYLLAADRNKVAIHRQNLIKNVFNNYAKHYRKIMIVVKETLMEVFGINLEEFESSKYILTNAIPNNTPHLLCPTDEQPHRILLVLVLTHIFMMNDACKEELLWDFLRKLTIITEESFQSEHFGDVQRIVTVDFVKQRYLVMAKIGSSDPPILEFQWGPRADEEISKRQVLEFVSKMYNNRPINTWPEQFSELSASERADLQLVE